MPSTFETIPVTAPPMAATATLIRNLVIAAIAFFTLVDLFAAQAILPSLAKAYEVSPAAMGFAVNASTIGMAVAGLAVSLFSGHIDRRLGIVVSLTILAGLTALLAVAPDISSFTILRIAQGLCMAAAFTLALAYLGEEYSMWDTAGAFAAYITGNVASNLIGRLVAAAAVDQLGIAGNFYLFAALNIGGAMLAWFTVHRMAAAPVAAATTASPFAAWAEHLANPSLRAAFAIGFCVLFAFIGTYTYVNFVLVEPPFSLSRMQLGLVYLVFLPSIITTPLAGRLVARIGVRVSLWSGLGLAVAGLALLLVPSLPVLLAGLVMVGVGTFFAQATATGYVGKAAKHNRGAASGLYLASYFAGGLAGTALLGPLFQNFGWPPTVGGIALALVAAAALTRWLAAD